MNTSNGPYFCGLSITFVDRKKRGELLSVSDIPSGSFFFINFSCTHRQKDTRTLIYTPNAETLVHAHFNDIECDGVKKTYYYTRY